MTAATAALVALVVQPHTTLRTSPHDAAPRPVTLWPGDLLEVRGERLGYLQVYDPRRERPGYVRPAQVHVFALEPASAPALKAVVDFLQDSPGSESLGIAAVAAYLKVARAEDLGADTFAALGTFAERLGRRASLQNAVQSDELAGQLEVAASYGVHYASVEDGERTRLCYDGEAFRRVLALGGSPEQRARAALALTRPECADPSQAPLERAALEAWQWEVLGRADPAAVAPTLGNALRLRRAAVASSLAFRRARQGQDAAPFAGAAVEALAAVERSELSDEELPLYEEAAARVGASRWAAAPAPAVARGDWTLSVRAKAPGERCLSVTRAKAAAPALERCAYAEIWLASARFDRAGDAVALSVQSLPAWTELWVLKRSGDAWSVDTLPPAPVDPELGYVEAAGWSADGRQLLVARAARAQGKTSTSFELLDASTLAAKKRAPTADALAAFRRWASPEWQPLRKGL